MTAIALDTHALVKKLRESGFDEPQSEALTEVVVSVHQSQLDELATKRDLRELEMKIDMKIADLRSEIIKWMFGVAAGQTAIVVALVKLLT